MCNKKIIIEFNDDVNEFEIKDFMKWLEASPYIKSAEKVNNCDHKSQKPKSGYVLCNECDDCK